jgi:hypothetical protein
VNQRPCPRLACAATCSTVNILVTRKATAARLH